MWWIFPVVLLISYIVFGILETASRDCTWKFYISLFSGILMIVSLAFCVFSADISGQTGKSIEIGDVETKKLYAFKDDTSINANASGGIFFWTVQVDDKLKYRYITDGDIGKVVKEEDIGGFEIIDNENTNPRIEMHTFQNLRTDPFWIWMFGEEANQYVINVVYIPSGSLTQEYNVNLE